MGLREVKSSEGGREAGKGDGVMRTAMTILHPFPSLALGRAEWAVRWWPGAWPCAPGLWLMSCRCE